LLINYYIKPHPALSAFVDNYILSTSGKDIYSFRSYWPASNETTIAFYLGDKPQHKTVTENSATFCGKKNCIVGPSTGPGGVISFNGRFHAFLVDFKANGINRIFGLPMCEFSDEIFTLEEVLGNQVAILEEQLAYATNIRQMACIADKFLLSFLSRRLKNNTFSNNFAAASDLINTRPNTLSIKQWACKTNMSIRNFQRRFKEQVGVSPKLYAKIVRFNEVLKRKIIQPGERWSSVTYECGYFDQMHLIKDFTTFTGFTPFDFFKNQHPQQVQMMPITRFTLADFFQMQRLKSNVTGIMSRRHKNNPHVNYEAPEEQLVIVNRED
jgi:AraC-like DNA-binding protein